MVWGDQVWLTNRDRRWQADVRHLCRFEHRRGEARHQTVGRREPTVLPSLQQLCIANASHRSRACVRAFWARTELPRSIRKRVKFFGRGKICLAIIFAEPVRRRLLFDNLLILTFDGFDYNYLAALDKNTGATVWKHDRNLDYGTDNGDYHKAFSTPQLVNVAGKRQLISPSAGATVAYDPATGEELWRIRSGGMNAAARPIYSDGLAYCIATGRRHRLVRIQA